MSGNVLQNFFEQLFSYYSEFHYSNSRDNQKYNLFDLFQFFSVKLNKLFQIQSAW